MQIGGLLTGTIIGITIPSFIGIKSNYHKKKLLIICNYTFAILSIVVALLGSYYCIKEFSK